MTSDQDQAIPEQAWLPGEGVCVSRQRMPGATSVGEPDAGDPHVRFDERDVETGQGGAIEAPSDERDGNR